MLITFANSGYAFHGRVNNRGHPCVLSRNTFGSQLQRSIFEAKCAPLAAPGSNPHACDAPGCRRKKSSERAG
eukprot:12923846-Prorocentrum_lima.AAC.1